MSIDTLIIGSGVAAAAVSQRLLDDDPNASILILEAGQAVKMQDAAIWQDYVISGKLPYTKYYDAPYPERDQPGQNLNIGGTVMPLDGSRVMTYGGSTIHWGGWSFRLKPEDFQLKSNTGYGVDWPFSYDHLEPWYAEAERYIGVSGDNNDPTVPRSQGYPFAAFPYTLEDAPVRKAMDALGIGCSHLPIARHGMGDTASRHAPCKTTGTCKYCPFGARYAATNFLNDMRQFGGYPNFAVKLNCVVQEIVMADKANASGVTYYDKLAKRYETLTAKRIIVAGGAIESPKLLLRSTSDYWPQGVGNDADLVGRNLITHPYFIFSGRLPANPHKLQPEMNFPTLCSRHFDSPAEQAKGKFILVNPPSSPGVNLAALMQSGQTPAQMQQSVTGAQTVQLHGMVEMFSHLKNRVMNLDEVNQIGLNETIVDYTQPADFDARMAEIGGHVKQIFDAMGVSMVGKPTVSWRADHASCTCRMSDSASEGVTDAHMRVHGVDNLYVCSNAAFCSSGAINPTLTLTALALRLGQHLIDQKRAAGA
ncbi:GMC oxidoreductase [Magnetofaba australis]|uniref:Putative glucose-methanol-choline oxidoreductase n=1 Tax=Magnetofaba australis IT-1 TaxID=1434232 RepID=A0A1Y2K8Q9_9PROT|nr:GMC family oxidoreductase [Magnetofaba australis]OSM05066.1 putative glucose-methanol-choline oxidoreductase [Magnetofaba australis IT-1]